MATSGSKLYGVLFMLIIIDLKQLIKMPRYRILHQRGNKSVTNLRRTSFLQTDGSPINDNDMPRRWETPTAPTRYLLRTGEGFVLIFDRGHRCSDMDTSLLAHGDLSPHYGDPRHQPC